MHKRVSEFNSAILLFGTNRFGGRMNNKFHIDILIFPHWPAKFHIDILVNF